MERRGHSIRDDVAALADALRPLDPDEIAPAIGLLVARPRQGRIGVGWRGLSGLDVSHAAEPGLTVLDVDGAVRRVKGGWESTGREWTYDEERYRRVAEARAADAELAARKGTQYAGEANPYKTPREPEDDQES